MTRSRSRFSDTDPPTDHEQRWSFSNGSDNGMAWWVWVLIAWGSVASAAVVYLAMQLSMHVEWREALLRERYDLMARGPEEGERLRA